MNYIVKLDYNKEEHMGNPIKVKYKFGQIEFEAEGDSNDVEKQRDYFMNAIIPVATTIVNRIPSIEKESLDNNSTTKCIDLVETETTIKPAIRDNLITFIMDYKDLSDRDFTLFAAFYHEQKTNADYSFTSEDVKNYFKEARRSVPKNCSDILQRLVKSGLIMDADNPENKTPKSYQITQSGINYINEYKPKKRVEKNKKTSANTRKKIESVYASLNSDDLNLSKYPAVKTLKKSKEQIILAMYIITKEQKGEWFKNSDIEYIMPNLFDTHITKDQVTNVFRQKSWFDEKNAEDEPKTLKHKLLSKAKEFAEGIIANS